MANFTDKRINQTYQRVVQVDNSVLQDGLGNTLSGSMGNLTVNGVLAVTGHPNVSASLSRLDYFSSSLDDTYARDAELAAVSSSLALETAQLLNFSASLDATYATDQQLSDVSSSLALETAQLLNFSASLDATFATDAQLAAGVDPLTAQTSSYALKSNISGAFAITSASLAARIAGLDADYATDAQLLALSSSISANHLTLTDWTFHSASIRNDIAIDSVRIANLEQKRLVSSSRQITGALDVIYPRKTEISGSFNILSSSFSDRLDTVNNDIAYDTARIGALEAKRLVSSSRQITGALDTIYPRKTEITGSFDILSGSFSDRFDTLDTIYPRKTEITGSFNTVSSSFATEIATIRNDISYDSGRIGALEAKRLVSSSRQITGALDTIYPRKTEITGSFSITSSSLASRIDAISGSLNIYQVTGSSTMPIENAYLIPNIINGGQDTTTAITASGTLFKLQYTSSLNGNHIVELPDASIPSNTYRKMRFISDNTVTANHTFTISGSNNQLIEGSATYLINRGYEGVMLWSDGTNWFRIQSKA